MRLSYVATCAGMTLRELSRRRLVLALALLVPVVFFAVVLATTGEGTLGVTLAGAAEAVTEVAERRQSLLFIGVAAAGLISAFFAASLVQRQIDANRRLVLCGYRPSEIIAARIAVLAGIVAGAGLYTWSLLALVDGGGVPAAAGVGIALGAFVYGGYGLLIGTLLRRELESIFAILVLINIDAGWLQNPIYYADSRSRWLIESLPAHYPSQVTYLAAFTDDGIAGLAIRGAAYGAALLGIALVLYRYRMRIVR